MKGAPQKMDTASSLIWRMAVVSTPTRQCDAMVQSELRPRIAIRLTGGKRHIPGHGFSEPT
jgi:hypothetical protein